jgi:hypothetical protein
MHSLVFADLDLHVCRLLKRAFYFNYISNYKYIQFLTQSSSAAAYVKFLKIGTSMFTHSLFHTEGTRGALTSGVTELRLLIEPFHPYRISKLDTGPDWHSLIDNTSF